MPLKLVVEGWRAISHSYAIVNQWQLLALARRRDLELQVSDAPLCVPSWRTTLNPFSQREVSVLSSLKRASASFRPDAVYRIAFPYDFSGIKTGRLAVFGTAEFGAVPKSYLKSLDAFKGQRDGGDAIAITPSSWSAQGFLEAGWPQDRLFVVPHGVDVDCFARRDRAGIRTRLGLRDFVFFSAGALTPNKGIDLLLKAFSIVVAKRPDCQLLLKGSDPLYSSASKLGQLMSKLPAADRSLVESRLVYVGDVLPMSKMAALYSAADVYVSPYRAEGFNLPVLEALAAGLPVICTSGGSTDDFASPDYAWRISSSVVPATFAGEAVKQLRPKIDHLVELMMQSIDRQDWRMRVAHEAPRYVRSQYSWDTVVDKLIGVLRHGSMVHGDKRL